MRLGAWRSPEQAAQAEQAAALEEARRWPAMESGWERAAFDRSLRTLVCNTCAQEQAWASEGEHRGHWERKHGKECECADERECGEEECAWRAHERRQEAWRGALSWRGVHACYRLAAQWAAVLQAAQAARMGAEGGREAVAALRADLAETLAREADYERQLDMGVIPPGTELAPRNPGVQPWNELSDDEKAFACRLQEAFAAFLDHTDVQLGRLLDALEDAPEEEGWNPA